MAARRERASEELHTEDAEDDREEPDDEHHVDARRDRLDEQVDHHAQVAKFGNQPERAQHAQQAQRREVAIVLGEQGEQRGSDDGRVELMPAGLEVRVRREQEAEGEHLEHQLDGEHGGGEQINLLEIDRELRARVERARLEGHRDARDYDPHDDRSLEGEEVADARVCRAPLVLFEHRLVCHRRKVVLTALNHALGRQGAVRLLVRVLEVFARKVELALHQLACKPWAQEDVSAGRRLAPEPAPVNPDDVRVFVIVDGELELDGCLRHPARRVGRRKEVQRHVVWIVHGRRGGWRGGWRGGRRGRGYSDLLHVGRKASEQDGDEEVEHDVIARDHEQHEVRRAPIANRRRGGRPHVVPVLARDYHEDGEHRIADRVEVGARRLVEPGLGGERAAEDMHAEESEDED